MEEAYAEKRERHAGERLCTASRRDVPATQLPIFRKGYKRPEEIGIRRVTHPNSDKINKQYAKHGKLRRLLTAGFTNLLGFFFQ